MLSFILSVLIAAIVFCWYDHVLLGDKLVYWQWLVLAIPIYLLTHTIVNGKGVSPAVKGVWQLFFVLAMAATCIGQLLSWMGVITLPIFKL